MVTLTLPLLIAVLVGAIGVVFLRRRDYMLGALIILVALLLGLSSGVGLH